jgi:hypothetical protein
MPETIIGLACDQDDPCGYIRQPHPWGLPDFSTVILYAAASAHSAQIPPAYDHHNMKPEMLMLKHLHSGFVE